VESQAFFASNPSLTRRVTIKSTARESSRGSDGGGTIMAMSDEMPDELPLRRELVKNVLAAAELQRSGTFSSELRDALNALNEHPEQLAGRLQIASQLKQVTSPVGAGFLGVWLGAGVESGIDPNLTTIPVLEALLRWIATIQTEPEGSSENEARKLPRSVIPPGGIMAMARCPKTNSAGQFGAKPILH